MNLRQSGFVKLLTFILIILAMVFAVHTPGVEKLTTETNQEINVQENKRSMARLTSSSIKLKRLIDKMSMLSILVYLYSSICYVLLTSVLLYYPSIARIKKRLLLRPIKFTSQYLN
ncbi:hypothetical protein E0485_14040 [Paenibacillus albiflavus]|uniref:Uncharacterized protein n=1 Tax=Paenibacillus albiflavus TaxID=2545760 RepID=A0A4R4EAL3_9BACL|nr:hypothetical protein [Paenibacillus albiflavus]TCZ76317.1 hypothetical protein E0485_14040 [Paenibacillus albiflavus]